MTERPLTKEQQRWVDAAVSPGGARERLLTGRAGTGKTTCSKKIVEVLQSQRERVLALSPTWAALKRMHACGINCDSSTMHSALVFPKQKKSNGEIAWEEKHKADVAAYSTILVDEAGMVPKFLADLLRKKAPHSSIIAIGDDWQLPPVNDACGFDLENSVVALTKVMRNDARDILRFAEARYHGERVSLDGWSDDGSVFVGRSLPDLDTNMRLHPAGTSANIFFTHAARSAEAMEARKHPNMRKRLTESLIYEGVAQFDDATGGIFEGQAVPAADFAHIVSTAEDRALEYQKDFKRRFEEVNGFRYRPHTPIVGDVLRMTMNLHKIGLVTHDLIFVLDVAPEKRAVKINGQPIDCFTLKIAPLDCEWSIAANMKKFGTYLRRWDIRNITHDVVIPCALFQTIHGGAFRSLITTINDTHSKLTKDDMRVEGVPLHAHLIAATFADHMSVYASQGNEFDRVTVHSSDFSCLKDDQLKKRRAEYTAATRAKKNLIWLV